MEMNLITARNAVNVEVCLRRNERITVALEQLRQPLKEYILARKLRLNETILLTDEEATSTSELSNVKSLLLECDEKLYDEFVNASDAEHFVFHLYWPQPRGMELEMFETDTEAGGAGSDDAAGGDFEAVPSSSHWLLPCSKFVGLWDNLIYEDCLKEKLLKFALSALTFSQHNVNQNIISCNRLILLHGPPGTGKTSLCKALAQKLAIRTRLAYNNTHLVEINSHSLFSKWFSESGKLVMRLFAKIREIVNDQRNLVCVLIDEVESLAYARNCMSGQEPKDAMRVVNALLTQLDSIKEHPNVLILATSNLADTIDLAFLDRADIKQYIGVPSLPAIRRIYESMLEELMRVGLVRREPLDDAYECLIDELAALSDGMSGRALRKLPFLAHAVHCAGQFGNADKIILAEFLDSLLCALEKYHMDQNAMRK